MTSLTKKIFQGLELTFAMAKVNFAQKTEGSYLGAFWHFLNPVLTFALLLLIFSKITGRDINLYPLYLLLGLIIFNFFQQTTIEATHALTEKHLLIRSFPFTFITVPAATVFSNAFSHFFELAVFVSVMAYFSVPLNGLIFYIPIFIIIFVFTLGCTLALSALTVYFADIKNIWNYGIKLLWFATPIFYSAEQHYLLKRFNTYNPLYYFIDISREIIIYQKIPSPEAIFFVAAFSVGTFLFGYFVFNSLKNKFPEIV